VRKDHCTRCGKAAWVNAADYLTGPPEARRVASGELCAECFAEVPLCAPPRGAASRGGVSSGPNHNDPNFDNVIRALEEDR
jgi:hypothetical protein